MDPLFPETSSPPVSGLVAQQTLWYVIEGKGALMIFAKLCYCARWLTVTVTRTLNGTEPS